MKLNILIVESTRTTEWRRRGGARSATVHRTRIINAWKFRLRLLIYSTILPVYVISLSPVEFQFAISGHALRSRSENVNLKCRCC